MNWLDRLERRFGFIAVPNLILIIVAGQVVATLLGAQHPGVVYQMILDPTRLAQGEWWRLLTFIFVPNVSRLGLIFAVFWFYFLWMFGQALESQWGAFRTTVYLLGGALFQALVSIVAWHAFRIPIYQNGYYWTLSLQLAFAHLFPEFTIYLFMILPVKMRWWAWVIGAMLIFSVFQGGLLTFFEIAGSLANYLIFFFPDYFRSWRARRETAGARAMHVESLRRAEAAAPVKKCKSCGKGVDTADIRLCLCDKCGSDGTFWCTQHLAGH